MGTQNSVQSVRSVQFFLGLDALDASDAKMQTHSQDSARYVSAPFFMAPSPLPLIPLQHMATAVLDPIPILAVNGGWVVWHGEQIFHHGLPVCNGFTRQCISFPVLVTAAALGGRLLLSHAVALRAN